VNYTDTELKEFTLSRLPYWAEPSSILMLALSGSRAYGTNTLTSDYDLVGIVAPPEEYIIGGKTFQPVSVVTDTMDLKMYSPEQFMQMVTKGSVNNLESLFLPTIVLDQVLAPWWRARKAFITRSTVASIKGYTDSFLRRFGDLEAGDQGSKRRELVTTYGYDTKAAVHAYRWLYMGLNLYQDPSQLTVHMEFDQRAFLKRVKAGQIPPEQVLADINELLATFIAGEAQLKDTLGKVPDDLPSSLLVDIHRKLLTQ